MKRDMNLIRTLLLVAEARPISTSFLPVELSDYTRDEIRYHAKLLGEAGLVLQASGELGTVMGNLTWQGHEFLELVRNDEVWHQACHLLGDEVGVMPFRLLEDVVCALMRSRVLRPS